MGDPWKNQRLTTMYKIKHNMTPTYMSTPLPQQNNQAGYELRNSTAIPGINTRTSSFQNSFFPQTIKDWNNLELEVQQAPSIYSFKSKLKKKKDTKHDPPDWFYCGERRFSIYHSRMRMMCSPLNDHLFSHIHVVDSPVCLCGSPRETAKHYLLECPLYIIERNKMLAELQELNFQPLLKNLLFGIPTFSTNINCKAFCIIQNFIKNTFRFDV